MGGKKEDWDEDRGGKKFGCLRGEKRIMRKDPP